MSIYKFLGKRLFDIVTASIAFATLAPLLILVAVCIFIEDSGPIFFSHQRIGRNGKPFLFYKFRSMPIGTPRVSSDQLGSIRLTKIGRIIRRTNIDELPQLINIIKGDMSVVGPRPSLLDQYELISLRLKSGVLRLRPGLTGLAQINSFDGMSVQQKAFLDEKYCLTIGFWLDIMIILRTFLYLFVTPPVY